MLNDWGAMTRAYATQLRDVVLMIRRAVDPDAPYEPKQCAR